MGGPFRIHAAVKADVQAVLDGFGDDCQGFFDHAGAVLIDEVRNLHARAGLAGDGNGFYQGIQIIVAEKPGVDGNKAAKASG